MIKQLRATLLAGLALAPACGSDETSTPGGSHDQTGSPLTFWQEPRGGSSYSWAEGKPTLTELSESADAVLLGRVVGVSPGARFPNPPEYFEVELNIQPLDLIRGSLAENVILTRDLNVSSKSEADAELARLTSNLPNQPALFLLRQRSDMPRYRVINGYGIWVDGPDRLYTPLEGGDPAMGPYSAEVLPYATVSELAESLRPAR